MLGLQIILAPWKDQNQVIPSALLMHAVAVPSDAIRLYDVNLFWHIMKAKLSIKMQSREEYAWQWKLRWK